MSGFQGIFGDTNNLGDERLDKYSLEEKMKDEQIAFCPAFQRQKRNCHRLTFDLWRRF